MKTSARGIKDLIHSEGKRNKAYLDSGGVLTIGVGHTASAGPPSPKQGMVISDQEVEEILSRDLAKFEARVNKYLPNVPQHVFDGAVSFDFNTGAIHKASWVDAYRRGDMKDAEARFKFYNKDNGKVVKGLVTRRAREADLIFRGKYFSPFDQLESPVNHTPEETTELKTVHKVSFLQLLFEFIVNLIKGKR